MATNSVTTTIVRWSPATCKCVVELIHEQTGTDKDGNPVWSDPKFLLLNDVCDNHRPLTSREFKADHGQLGQQVLSYIEEAKAKNLKQVNDLLAQPNLRLKTRKELQRCKQQVIQFNADLDDEWGELLMFPHAFDDHIHQQILSEQKPAKVTAV